jgi:hypothetical protein
LNRTSNHQNSRLWKRILLVSTRSNGKTSPDTTTKNKKRFCPKLWQTAGEDLSRTLFFFFFFVTRLQRSAK